MAKHACLVPPFDEEAWQQLHALLEVLPLQLPLDEAGVDGLEQLLVSHGVQWGQRHIEDGQWALKGWIGHELHVALQLVELCQWDGHDFVAGTLDHQVASLKQIQSEFEIQVGALAAWDQVATEFANCDRVGLSVQADIVHDILAAIDSVLDIRIEVVAYLFVVSEVIQGDLGERQKAGNLLLKRRGQQSYTEEVMFAAYAKMSQSNLNTQIGISNFLVCLCNINCIPCYNGQIEEYG